MQEDAIDRLAALWNLNTILIVDGVYAMVRAAETEIARRGLGKSYTAALVADVSDDLFAIATAPPEARVRAILKTLGC